MCEPLEVFLLSGQRKVSATCIPLFFFCTPSRSARFGRRSGACGDFFSGASCAAACSATGFSPGGAFSRQTSVPRIPLDLECSCCEGERGVHSSLMGTFLPPAIFFRGLFLLSCPGGFPEGGNFLPEHTPAVFSAWAEFPRDLNVFSGAFRRTSALPLPGRDTKNLGNLLHSGHVIRGQGVFSFRCRGAIRRIWSASFSMASFFPVPWASLWKFFCSPVKERFPPPEFCCFCLRSRAFRALPAEGVGPVEIFFSGASCAAAWHAPQQAFFLGEPFSGRHLFRTFLSAWNVPAAKGKGECTGHSWELSFLLPYFFRGLFLLSCPGGFPEGGNFLPDDTACRTSCLGGVSRGIEYFFWSIPPGIGVLPA